MISSYDLVLKGGEVVNHDGRGMADIGIVGGKIVAIGHLGHAAAGQVMDVAGLTILPGVIDTQVEGRPGERQPRRRPGRRHRGVRNAQHRAHHHRP